jgi:hypothetical protein
MNFYGLETPSRVPVCSWKNPPSFYLDILQTQLSINTIRIPFSYEYLCGNDLSLLDDLINECYIRNMTVILDYHRTWSTHQSPVPDEGISLEEFENAWVYVLNRFQDYPNVEGVGIFNEIQGSDPVYAGTLHQRVIQFIESKFPYRFTYFAGCVQWGGNCEKVGPQLQDMLTWNRTILDVHRYSFSSGGDESDWDRIIPLDVNESQWFVGEIGWHMTSTQDKSWAYKFLSYLEKRNIRNVCLWTIAHSYDTGGWFNDDCESFDYEKARMLSDTIWRILPSNRQLRAKLKQ